MSYSGEDLLHGVLEQMRIVVGDIDSGPVTLATHIADSGIDSLQALELIVRLEEAYDIRLPDHEMAEVRTFGDLIAVMQNALQAGAQESSDVRDV